MHDAEFYLEAAKLISKHYGDGPHPGTGTPQSVHGGGASDKKLKQEIDVKEGFSLRWPSGELVEAGKDLGFSVALQGAEEIYDYKDFTPNDIRRYRNKHRDALADPATLFGAWWERETGLIYLDISVLVDDEVAAMALAKKNRQKAIYDLRTGRVMEVSKAAGRVFIVLPKEESPKQSYDRIMAAMSEEIAKHPEGVKIHPGTGTDQGVHNPKPVASGSGRKTGRILDDQSPRNLVGVTDFDEVDAHDIFDASLIVDGEEYISRVTSVSDESFGDDQRVYIGGIIEGPDGREIGHFDRFLYLNQGMVKNSEFKIDPGWKGRGVGTMFLNHWEDEFAAAGFTRMQVTTAWDGTYVWAMYGYNYRSDSAPIHRTDHLQQLGEFLSSSTSAKYPPHVISEVESFVIDPGDFQPIDIALLGRTEIDSQNMWFGKDFLLNKAWGWNGEKEIGVSKAMSKDWVHRLRRNDPKRFERLFLQGLSDRPWSKREDGITKATAENSGIAVVLEASPESQGRWVHDDGLPPDELHATLGFFGKTGEAGKGDDLFLDLIGWVAGKSREYSPIYARTTEVKYLGDDDPRAAVVSLEHDYLLTLRESLDQGIRADHMSRKHPNFNPHMTIGYGVDLEDIEAGDYVEFDRLSLWWGEEKFSMPLSLVAKHGDDTHNEKDHNPHKDKRIGGGQRSTSFTDPRTGKKMTPTHIGNTFEKLLLKVGMKGPLADADSVWSARSGFEQNPIDLLVGEWAIEVKSVNFQAKNWKATIKKPELAKKYAEAKRLGRRPATLIQVVNQQTRTVDVHWFPDLFGSKSVKSRTPSWSYTYTESDIVSVLGEVGA